MWKCVTTLSTVCLWWYCIDYNLGSKSHLTVSAALWPRFLLCGGTGSLSLSLFCEGCVYIRLPDALSKKGLSKVKGFLYPSLPRSLSLPLYICHCLLILSVGADSFSISMGDGQDSFLWNVSASLQLLWKGSSFLPSIWSLKKRAFPPFSLLYRIPRVVSVLNVPLTVIQGRTLRGVSASPTPMAAVVWTIFET